MSKKIRSDKQGSDGLFHVRAPDGLPDQMGHRQDLDFFAFLRLGSERDGVGYNQLLQGRFLDFPNRRAREHRMSATTKNSFCPLSSRPPPPWLMSLQYPPYRPTGSPTAL